MGRKRKFNPRLGIKNVAQKPQSTYPNHHAKLYMHKEDSKHLITTMWTQSDRTSKT